MLKKISGWLIFLLLHVAMIWVLAAVMQSALSDEDSHAASRGFFGFEKLDSLLEEQLFQKEQALYLRTQISLAMGNEKIGDIYISEERLLREPQELDTVALSETAAILSQFYGRYTIPTCVTAIPSAAEIYTESLPDHADVPSQLPQLDFFYEELDAKIRKVDAYHVLSTFKEDYIYCRTDSHWTAYGAYCVYRNVIRRMGYYPVPYDSCTIAHVQNDVRGDLYKACLYSNVVPDILDIYTCENSRDIVTMRTFDGTAWTDTSFYNEQARLDGNAAHFYMGAPVMQTVIQTNAENEKRILVIKDSYGDAMVPFLTQHYAQLDVIDITCLDRPLDSLLDPDAYQQMLVLCDADTLEETEAFSWMIGGTNHD